MDFFVEDTPENREKYFAEMERRMKILPKNYREEFFSAMIDRIRFGEMGVIIAGEFEKVLYKNLRRVIRNKIDNCIDNSHYFGFPDVYKRISFVDKTLFDFEIIKENFEVEIKEYGELHKHDGRIYCRGQKMNCYGFFK